MNRENKKLKRKLIIQSFLPLSILVIIKNVNMEIWVSFSNFVKRLLDGEISVLMKLFKHPHTWSFLLIVISVIVAISGVIAIWQFREVQFSGFTDAGEKVKIEEKITDSGITFFMTFILPLLMDNIVSFNDFAVYIGIILLVGSLMTKTNLYYQNPILTLLGYKLYKIKFLNASLKECENKQFIAVCKDELNEDNIVKWKFISDDICFMYNKH